ncbi:MAG: transcriptional regulator [Balneola sp.]|jgi:putative transcriptional regulator|nr:transcriptional regulator [Balneola sp.]MBE80300.1 transcriptional regulator [Balneola sp.]HBX65605.1 transcriptional regulator [Balneolaceae bacterium]|tara:strand:+ start:24 stop:230 length:207 start_codon:yes stop_codon:yes gene_type:complete
MNNTIKVERARNSLSQSDLAEKVGVTRQTIYAIETKRFIPSTVLAFKLAKILKVEVSELFELEEEDWD